MKSVEGIIQYAAGVALLACVFIAMHICGRVCCRVIVGRSMTSQGSAELSAPMALGEIARRRTSIPVATRDAYDISCATDIRSKRTLRGVFSAEQRLTATDSSMDNVVRVDKGWNVEPLWIALEAVDSPSTPQERRPLACVVGDSGSYRYDLCGVADGSYVFCIEPLGARGLVEVRSCRAEAIVVDAPGEIEVDLDWGATGLIECVFLIGWHMSVSAVNGGMLNELTISPSASRLRWRVPKGRSEFSLCSIYHERMHGIVDVDSGSRFQHHIKLHPSTGIAFVLGDVPSSRAESPLERLKIAPNGWPEFRPALLRIGPSVVVKGLPEGPCQIRFEADGDTGVGGDSVIAVKSRNVVSVRLERSDGRWVLKRL